MDSDYDESRLIGDTRQEAIAHGFRYYRGAPCCHGHEDGVRYVSTRACYDCIELVSIYRTRAVRKRDRERKRQQRARARDKAPAVANRSRRPPWAAFIEMVLTLA